ncbi:MAG: leucyl/phenylalanyl-tRNA--protein transferase [Micavibrio aeruginosavorus]|uniref:Leucyl/phenylalanyl-tRNA--protein transferase n=1 Tax=Micavibrio aeruginosavorus TaxID=349221 RepID=A0A7T5R2Y3_9BACT|nr:MAG: leucyl/phenylalanyl-tRNA--protein transferase [Micavibrio aeruginosavorus]
MPDEITTADVLAAYAMGLFPMAESRDSDEIWWFDPPRRGQLDIAKLHIPSRLKRTVLRHPYDIRIDTAFAAVIDACAAIRTTQVQTWINCPIRDLFIALHRQGFAHSVEAWRDNKLVGGLYGLALGGAFCGESMFSAAPNASKICLVHLCARLWKAGFTLLDTQYVNDHLKQFGAYEIDNATYKLRLQQALGQQPDFHLGSCKIPDARVLVTLYMDQR